uniref:Uncharacterized protein n=1 Tax=Setaria viridis TaxID=4556 RepID=A0A4U6U060_SETVI|nr:hypothetical protein SEVIR_6G047950v2 [Setaria viridis]
MWLGKQIHVCKLQLVMSCVRWLSLPCGCPLFATVIHMELPMLPHVLITFFRELFLY